jgi:hypothetical protein
MNTESFRTTAFAVAILVVGTLALSAGCSSRHAIITSTATNIGVDISQNPTTNSPQARLGYQRVEFAIVPTNRSADIAPDGTGGGASDHGNVLMELRYTGIFDTGPSSGIYQRLAVGDTAVRQPGASLMFARDVEGKVSAEAEAALMSLKSVPAPSKDIQGDITKLRKLRACRRQEVDAAISSAGAGSFDDVVDLKFTVEQLTNIMTATKDLPVCSK